MNFLTRSLIPMLICMSIQWANAQTVSTYGATAPLLPTESVISVTEGSTVTLSPLSVQSNLPDLEYAIQVVGLPASDTLGDQIVGFVQGNTFNINDFGLQDGDQFRVTPIAYELAQSQDVVHSIFNGNFILTPCCDLVAIVLPNTCENLEAAGISQGSDVQGLEDVLDVIFTFAGDTSLTASTLGLASWLDGFNEIASSLPASCGGDSVPLCYALTSVENGTQLYTVEAACPINLVLNPLETGSKAYTVSNSIVSTDMIDVGEDVLYDAGSVVELQNGFSVDANADLSVTTEGCTPQ